MSKKVSYPFLTLFITLLFVPTIITYSNCNEHIAIFIDCNEEEENKSKESSESLDTEFKIISKVYSKTTLISDIKKLKNVCFLSKNYEATYIHIKTPPPEIFFLA